VCTVWRKLQLIFISFFEKNYFTAQKKEEKISLTTLPLYKKCTVQLCTIFVMMMVVQKYNGKHEEFFFFLLSG
jgi:hypothetical protein